MRKTANRNLEPLATHNYEMMDWNQRDRKMPKTGLERISYAKSDREIVQIGKNITLTSVNCLRGKKNWRQQTPKRTQQPRTDLATTLSNDIVHIARPLLWRPREIKFLLAANSGTTESFYFGENICHWWVSRCHHFFAWLAANLKLFSWLLHSLISELLRLEKYFVQCQVRGLHDMLPSLRVDDGSLHPTFFWNSSSQQTQCIQHWCESFYSCHRLLVADAHLTLFWKNEHCSLIYFCSHQLSQRLSDSSNFLCGVFIPRAPTTCSLRHQSDSLSQSYLALDFAFSSTKPH